MIEGKKYIETVKNYFSFLTTEFNFYHFEDVINGNLFYDVKYKKQDKIVSVSYENGEGYLQIIIFLLEDGELPHYDDKTRTLHLNRLNEITSSKINKNEREVNNQLFAIYKADNEIEIKLLKSAKELRLCLIHSEGIT